MFRRIIGCVLAATLLLSALPLATLAENAEVLYGDVNADGEIDAADLLTLKLYIAEENPSDFNFANADVNMDDKVNMTDLLTLKKHLAGWNVQLGPKVFSVSFYDGDRLIDTLYGRDGSPLGKVPATEKTSKSNAIFAGWYADPDFSTPFYADAPLTANTKAYAKYDELNGSELTVASFAQTDMGTDASFKIIGNGDLNEIKLVTKDGSDPVKLKISGEGPYTVTAEDGFNAGASYEMTIPEGFCYIGSSGDALPETVRTAAFTIKKEAVDNLRLSDDTHYVQNADPSALNEGSTVSLANAKVGDLICFYKTTNPKDRDYKSGKAYTNDPETWFKVGAVNGGTVTLAKLDDSDNEKLYEIPDNFPVKGALPTGNSGTLTLDGSDPDGYALDTDLYKQMVEEGVTANLAHANEKISVGDYVSIYVSADDIDGDDDIYFGKVTAYNTSTGEITYIKSSAEEIEASMDLYIQPALEGDEMISEEAKRQIEQTVLEQIKDSGFAEEAGFMLADMATRTDGFRNMDSVKMLLSDENGNPLSDEEIALLNLGKSFELKDGITLTVEIITSGDQIHFKNKGSVQLAIGIDAEFEVEVEDGKIVIDLSATFVQEIGIGITASGGLVKTEILGIPIPVGVKVGASVDILSYTAVSVNVRAYTVAEEDTPIWEQLKNIVTNPESLIDVLPAGDKFEKVIKGIETVGQVFDKIDEINEKIEQIRDDAEQAQGYLEDLEMLWEMVGEMQASDLPTKEKWEEIGKTLCKTNVSKDLMDMLGISTETELDADRYAEGLDGLLAKYSEMLAQETDWVKLVQKEMFQLEYCYLGLVIYCKADFVVRADMNIAMGASIQYQVGKRYSFWMKIGLFLPQAGSSTMDLVDEEFAFQFYVMGKLGIKMGIEATVGLAIGSADVARVGVHLELGPYVKIYGFFIYEYGRTREANTSAWKSYERMAGALYLEFGLYLIVGIDAAALNDMFEVSYDFVDAEFPLLEVGEKKYPYGFNYEPVAGEQVLIQDADGNSTNGIKMILPSEYSAIAYCNLTNGKYGVSAFDWDSYNYYFSNPAFSIDENGAICVDSSSGARTIECDLTITYKYAKMAFSTYDMQVTIPLVWTNLSAEEFLQYYTASVRVGNDTDGYNTVWTKHIRKNQEFTLPTEDELKALIGYNDAEYASISFPDSGKTEKIVVNATYDCTVEYTDYAVTVNGIQNTDGTTRSETFHTTYGGMFDFSSLAGTGTRKAGTSETAKYTAFSGVATTATVTANGQEQVIDLTQPISGKVAEAIRSGSVAATAEYADDSVLVTYVFTGIDVPDHTERIRKGAESDYDFSAVAAANGMAIKSVTPALGKVNATTTYYVECGKSEGPSFTISFEENGGSAVTNISRVGGSLIGNLPVTERNGYVFGGWYADSGLSKAFETKLMPDENITVYAKWTAIECKATLNVNGGNNFTANESPVTVTYDGTYGTLPAPTRDGHSFIGWFTAADGGSKVTAQTKVSKVADHTLYAHWHELVNIPQSFAYSLVTTTYETNKQVENIPSAVPAGDTAHPLTLSDFTVKFLRQGSSTYCTTAYPIDAGTWDAVVSFPGDAYYAPFEQLCSAAIIINKATREIGKPTVTVKSSHFSYLTVELENGIVADLHPNAKLAIKAYETSQGLVSTELIATATSANAAEPIKVSGLTPATSYALAVTVTGDPNYNDATAKGYSNIVTTDGAPEGTWGSNFSIGSVKTVNINYDFDMAILTDHASRGESFEGYTFNLLTDLDMSDKKWKPIGTEEVPFAGTFNGNGHTISGLYVVGQEDAGLFGAIGGNAVIRDVIVADSYINGTQNTGGIVGSNPLAYLNGNITDKRVNVINCTNRATVRGGAENTGGIMGSLMTGTIDGCVNEGRVFNNQSDNNWTGGIAGESYQLSASIINCINYGSVKGTDNVGGIAGSSLGGLIANSANFGSVKGESNVGGIVGLNRENTWSRIFNCYTVGAINGTNQYIGAAVGRNVKDAGTVLGVYYLQNSAKCNNSNRNALGTKNGSLEDGDEGTETAYFTSSTSNLSRDAGGGTANLITALNNWVSEAEAGKFRAWVAGADGYPLPIGE